MSQLEETFQPNNLLCAYSCYQRKTLCLSPFHVPFVQAAEESHHCEIKLLHRSSWIYQIISHQKLIIRIHYRWQFSILIFELVLWTWEIFLPLKMCKCKKTVIMLQWTVSTRMWSYHTWHQIRQAKFISQGFTKSRPQACYININGWTLRPSYIHVLTALRTKHTWICLRFSCHWRYIYRHLDRVPRVQRNIRMYLILCHHLNCASELFLKTSHIWK